MPVEISSSCLVSGTRSYFQTFKAQKVSESKVAPEDIGQFSADSLNKAVPSFRNSLTLRVTEDILSIFRYCKNVLTYVVCAVSNS